MGWPKGKPRGPRKKAAVKKTVTFGEPATPAQETAKKEESAGYYRSTHKAAVFCSQGRVEYGQVVKLDDKEAKSSPWWESCQKPD